MKKIIFGITSLTLGGAERVLVDIANKLCDIYEIEILTIYANGELEKEVNNKIKVTSIYSKSFNEYNKLHKTLIVFKTLLLKKQIYNKYIGGNYEKEIAFLEGAITRIFSVKSSQKEGNKKNNINKKIVWVHNDISNVFGKGIKSKLKRKLDEKTYSKFGKIIFVSKDNKEKFIEIYPNIKNNKQVIVNYIDKEKVIKKSEEKIDINFNKDKINIVTVARLVPQKAIDRFMKVYKRLQGEKDIECDIYVIGDGPEYQNLKNKQRELNIEGSFKLLGKKVNPYPYIKNSNYFVLFSQFEGYGMVIEEAKILGKNILITNTAAREAIVGYKNSKTFDNTQDGIYLGLKEILRNFDDNKKEEKIEKYNNEYILEEIKNLLND